MRGDTLSELTLCEDDAVRANLSPTTVVFKNLFGTDTYARRIMPFVEQLSIRSTGVGLTDEGIAVTFRDVRDASMVRLLFDGETAVQ